MYESCMIYIYLKCVDGSMKNIPNHAIINLAKESRDKIFFITRLGNRRLYPEMRLIYDSAGAWSDLQLNKARYKSYEL
jgi:hypothetical protein